MIGHLIKTIRVAELFGLYTYILPNCAVGLPDAAILYGDNGSGKSTVLRLVFHLLSPMNTKGHRTALTQVPYRSLEVELVSGVTFKAVRGDDIESTELTLSIEKQGSPLATWTFDPLDHAQSRVYSEAGRALGEPKGIRRLVVSRHSIGRGAVRSVEAVYMAVLREYAPTVYLLNADRRLDSDFVADPDDEFEMRHIMRYEEARRLSDLVARSREIALSQALSSAGKWISKHAVQGANQGSTNVHSVYANVLKHLVASTHRKTATDSRTGLAKLMEALDDVETRSRSFAAYELTAALSTDDFKSALEGSTKTKRDLAVSLLRPYIESLQGRLQALDSIYKVVDGFVTTTNTFLSDKNLNFKLSGGFTVQNRLCHELEPKQLSSGEQQLLLLFCYVLAAREQRSVFIIDEPEISLNVKWQRQLVNALLGITKGADVQFIFASHSMELLAQHRERVVKMEQANNVAAKV